MPRKKKKIKYSDLTEHDLEAIARCFLPDIIALYESEEGQKEFAEWLAQQENKGDENEQTEK